MVSFMQIIYQKLIGLCLLIIKTIVHYFAFLIKKKNVHALQL